MGSQARRGVSMVIFALLMAAHNAQASTECEKNYQVQTNARGTLHLVHVGMPEDDPTRVLPGMREMAKRNKFEPIGNLEDDGVHALVYAQPSSKTVRGFPLAFLASAPTRSVIAAMELPTGMTAPEPWKQMCAFLAAAELKGQGKAADAVTKQRNLTFTKEIFSGLAGDSAPRQERLLQERGALIQQSLSQLERAEQAEQVEQAGDDRGAAPGVPDTRKVLTPKAPFDESGLDKSRLDEGSSTIKGITCGAVQLGSGSEFQPAANQRIMLLPYTDYIREAVTLMEHKSVLQGKARVELDPSAFSNHIVGMTNEKGWFQFNRIKPGRYLITTTFDGAAVRFRDLPNSSYDGSTRTVYTWTERQRMSNSVHNMLQADVTVKQDGEVVDGVVAKSRNGATIPLTGLRVPVLSVACRMQMK